MRACMNMRWAKPPGQGGVDMLVVARFAVSSFTSSIRRRRVGSSNRICGTSRKHGVGLQTKLFELQTMALQACDCRD